MKALVAFFKAGAPWSIIIALLVLVLAAVPVAAVLGLLSIGLDAVYMNGRLIRAMGRKYMGAAEKLPADRHPDVHPDG